MKKLFMYGALMAIIILAFVILTVFVGCATFKPRVQVFRPASCGEFLIQSEVDICDIFNWTEIKTENLGMALVVTLKNPGNIGPKYAMIIVGPHGSVLVYLYHRNGVIEFYEAFEDPERGSVYRRFVPPPEHTDVYNDLVARFKHNINKYNRGI